MNVVGASLAISFAFDLKLQSAVQRLTSYHSTLILSRSRSHLFRTFKASCRFTCAHLQVVRGATVWEFTTIPSDCQIRPLALFGRTVVLNSAVGRLQRNESKVYHTLPGLSNSRPCLTKQQDRWILRLGGACPSVAQRGKNLPHPVEAVKSMLSCSHDPAASRFVRCSPSAAQRGATIPPYHDPVKSG